VSRTFASATVLSSRSSLTLLRCTRTAPTCFAAFSLVKLDTPTPQQSPRAPSLPTSSSCKSRLTLLRTLCSASGTIRSIPNHPSCSRHSYYIIFAELYSLSLRQADVLMVNSTWTNRHINHLLKPFGWRDDVNPEDEVDEKECTAEPAVAEGESAEQLQDGSVRRRRAFLNTIGQSGAEEMEEETIKAPRKPTSKTRCRRARTVYPPCDTVALAALPLEPRENIILTVAQFRYVFAFHLAFDGSLTPLCRLQAGEGAQRPIASPSPPL
jgi:hypothetical protein